MNFTCILILFFPHITFVKHTEMLLCMKFAIQINFPWFIPCVVYGFQCSSVALFCGGDDESCVL